MFSLRAQKYPHSLITIYSHSFNAGTHTFRCVRKTPDLQKLQRSTRPLVQRRWLAEKFKLYQVHHDSKTLKQFFPSLYEEYFAVWPPTPTAEDISAVKGNLARAVAQVQSVEEHVRTFELPE